MLTRRTETGWCYATATAAWLFSTVALSLDSMTLHSVSMHRHLYMVRKRFQERGFHMAGMVVFVSAQFLNSCLMRAFSSSPSCMLSYRNAAVFINQVCMSSRLLQLNLSLTANTPEDQTGPCGYMPVFQTQWMAGVQRPYCVDTGYKERR